MKTACVGVAIIKPHPLSIVTLTFSQYCSPEYLEATCQIFAGLVLKLAFGSENNFLWGAYDKTTPTVTCMCLIILTWLLGHPSNFSGCGNEIPSPSHPHYHTHRWLIINDHRVTWRQHAIFQPDCSFHFLLAV